MPPRNTQTRTKPQAKQAKATDKTPATCQALEIGHKACQCGGPHCGQNIGAHRNP